MTVVVSDPWYELVSEALGEPALGRPETMEGPQVEEFVPLVLSIA